MGMGKTDHWSPGALFARITPEGPVFTPWSRFRIRILVPFLVLTLVLVAAAAVVAVVTLQSLFDDRSQQAVAQLLDKTVSQVEREVQQMDQVALSVVTNPTVLEAFLAPPGPPTLGQLPFDRRRESLMEVLTSLYVSRNAPTRITVFDDRGNHISIGSPDTPSAVAARMGAPGFTLWYQNRAPEAASRLELGHPDYWTSPSAADLVSVWRELRVFGGSDRLAVVEVQQTLDRFRDLLSLPGPTTLGVFLVSDQGRVAVGPPGNSWARLWARPERLWRKDVPGTTWSVVFLQSERDFSEPFRVSGLMILGLGFGLLIVSWASVFFISARLTRPLTDMVRSLDQVSLHNLTYQEAANGQDEVAILQDAFRQMLGRLGQSLEEVVDLRTREANAQMLALQAQMNPHFLFNTLQVISGAGQEAGSAQVVDLCDRLSTLLRYLLEDPVQLPTLAEEWDHARTYLDLMKSRFEDLVSYRFDIAPREKLEAIRVPRLLIQPLVENCFDHGFRGRPGPWHLDVAVAVGENGAWTVEVRDDGSGFDPGVLADLRAKIANLDASPAVARRDTEGHHLGIWNTYVRLKWLWGPRVTLEIGGPGAIVTVTKGAE
jgi:two-component system sensor histidine kinase YesM